MDEFEFSRSELPTVEWESSHELMGGPAGEEGNYFKSGDWTFSDLGGGDGDGDIEATRQSVLSYIAWYEYLINRR